MIKAANDYRPVAVLIDVAILDHILVDGPATARKAVMSAIAIKATIRPYSIAVAPFLSCRNRLSFARMIRPDPPSSHYGNTRGTAGSVNKWCSQTMFYA